LFFGSHSKRKLIGNASIHRLHALVPLLVFRVNIAEPQIALDAVDSRRQIAGQFVRRLALTLSVGTLFVFGLSYHPCTSRHSNPVRPKSYFRRLVSLNVLRLLNPALLSPFAPALAA